MNQPQVIVNGKKYDVESVCWNRGKVSHFAIHKDGRCLTIFAPYGDLSWHDADGFDYQVEFKEETK